MWNKRLWAVLLAFALLWPVVGIASEDSDRSQLVSYFREEDLALCPMQEGDSGDAVSRLQIRLRSLGYGTLKHRDIYDATTSRDVAFFQGQNDLPQTGVADEATLLALYRWDAPLAMRSPMYIPDAQMNSCTLIPAYVYWYLHHEQMESLCQQAYGLTQGYFLIGITHKAPCELRLNQPEKYPHALPLVENDAFRQQALEQLCQQDGLFNTLSFSPEEGRFAFKAYGTMGGCFVNLVYHPEGFEDGTYQRRLNEHWAILLHGAT